MIFLADFGYGNLRSVENALFFIGSPSIVTADPDLLSICDRIVISGVGSFDSAIRRMKSMGKLLSAIEHSVFDDAKPILGICVGMQVLFEGSAEGHSSGLGWFAGNVESIRDFSNLPVPHMGWNSTRPHDGSRLLGTTVEEFYFCHSFAVPSSSSSFVSGSVRYGSEWAASVEEGNIYGVQFHPEKSQKAGLRLLKRFSEV